MEAGGVWGPAAQKFFNDCASKADNLDRDIDLYHWSSAKFCSAWRDTISVLVARGRAQVGVHAAKSDWSIYKNKGDKDDPGKYRFICLLTHSYKLLSTLLLKLVCN